MARKNVGDAQFSYYEISALFAKKQAEYRQKKSAVEHMDCVDNILHSIEGDLLIKAFEMGLPKK